MGRGPPGDMHDAVCRAEVKYPRRKVDIEQATHVAKAIRRTMTCST